MLQLNHTRKTHALNYIVYFLVKHAEQRKWVKQDQRANILHLLKSRALCVRTVIICIVWVATALVYYGLVIGLFAKDPPQAD